ncbi:hypothetical protein BKA93DRAFT_326292 [Sparassis latifolia]
MLAEAQYFRQTHSRRRSLKVEAYATTDIRILRVDLWHDQVSSLFIPLDLREAARIFENSPVRSYAAYRRCRRLVLISPPFPAGQVGGGELWRIFPISRQSQWRIDLLRLPNLAISGATLYDGTAAAMTDCLTVGAERGRGMQGLSLVESRDPELKLA